MYDFIPGQRCISDAELEMGLGTVLAVDERTVTIVFIATGDTRIYSRESAPLTRIVFSINDTISSHEGDNNNENWELLQVKKTKRNMGKGGGGGGHRL